MHGVILAAGRGSRLGTVTDVMPKGMVPLADRPLVEWQHAAMKAAGIPEVTVVTGYLGDMFSERGFRTILNTDWDRGNMVSSLACALDEIPGPLVVSYSDIVYSAESIRALLESSADLALTYDRQWLNLWSRRFDNPLADAETFRLDGNGMISEIGRKATTVAEIEGQFMGLLKLNTQGRIWIDDVFKANPDARLSLDTTALLQNLIAAGRLPKGVPIDGGWCEIDNLDDLAVAEALVREGRLTVTD